MPFRRSTATVKDAIYGQLDLEAQCQRCGRRGKPSLVAVARAGSPATRLIDLEHKLRCRVCRGAGMWV